MTTTADEAALLHAIRAHPAEDTPRLAYADWLDENASDGPCPRCRGAALTPGWVKVRDWVWRPTRTDCRTCRSTGRLSDGRRERAEFIRIDIEIERLHQSTLLFDPTVSLATVNGPIRDLRDRQRPLWREWHNRWFGWGTGTENFGSALTPNEVDPRVRRGFVFEVRLTLATFLDAAPAMFAIHPIERVIPSDRRPGEIPNPHFGTYWCWFPHGTARIETGYVTSSIPARLWQLLPANSRPSRDHPRGVFWGNTRDEAMAALSAACVAYGRGLAGLPPIHE